MGEILKNLARCLVSPNHSPCKDLVHHPIGWQPFITGCFFSGSRGRLEQHIFYDLGEGYVEPPPKFVL